jgi:hypothetical protein
MFYVDYCAGIRLVAGMVSRKQTVLMVISASYCQDVAEMNHRTPEVVRPAWKPFV